MPGSHATLECQNHGRQEARTEGCLCLFPQRSRQGHMGTGESWAGWSAQTSEPMDGGSRTLQGGYPHWTQHVDSARQWPWRWDRDLADGWLYDEAQVDAGGASVDQLIAKVTGKHTMLPSLDLSIQGEGIFPTVSLAMPFPGCGRITQQRAIYPRMVYDRMFRMAEDGFVNQGVVDLVYDQAKGSRGDSDGRTNAKSTNTWKHSEESKSAWNSPRNSHANRQQEETSLSWFTDLA